MEVKNMMYEDEVRFCSSMWVYALNVLQSALRVMVLRFYICQTQIDVLSFYM